MMRILCDIDGVLADLLPSWLDAWERASGERIHPFQITQYGFSQVTRDPEGFDKTLARVNYGQVRPFSWGLVGVERLRNAGHDLRFISYVPGWAQKHYHQKAHWLARHVPGFDPAELTYCHSTDKQYVAGDVLIEDYPKTLDQWLARHPEGRGFLVDHLYNQVWEHPRCIRVRDVAQAATILENEVLHAA